MTVFDWIPFGIFMAVCLYAALREALDYRRKRREAQEHMRRFYESEGR